MRVHPTVAETEDRRIAASLAAHEQSGLLAAYDAYASSLYGYCWSLLRDDDEATDTLQDTFIVAFECAGQLTAPEMLRAWLYALARNECLRRLATNPAGGPLALVDVPPEGLTRGAGDDASEEDLPTFVWVAAEALSRDEREVLELSMRQGLDSAELAAVLGIAPSQAEGLVVRATQQLERAFAALRLALVGREACADLDNILGDDWTGHLDPPLLRRLVRHIENCVTCGERKGEEQRPADLYQILPVVGVPLLLRDRLTLVASDPETASYRDTLVREAEPLDRQGFPVPLDRPKAPRRGRTIAVISAAAVIVVALIAVLLANSGNDGASANPGRAAMTVPPSAPALIFPASAPPSTTALPPPTTTAPPSTTRPPQIAPSRHPAAPKTTAPPAPAVLLVSTTSISVGRNGGQFTLTAENGAVSWSARVETGWGPFPPYQLSDTGGTLQAGESETITVMPIWRYGMRPPSEVVLSNGDTISID